MKTTKLGKERLNLDMHPEVKAQLLDLQERLKADSMSEVLRRALQVFDTLQQARETDSVILIRDRDGKERQLLIT